MVAALYYPTHAPGKALRLYPPGLTVPKARSGWTVAPSHFLRLERPRGIGRARIVAQSQRREVKRMGSRGIVVGILGLILVVGTVAEAKTAATVTCTDGTTSKAGRGACGHHGGVAALRSPANASASTGRASKASVAAAASAGDAAGAAAKCKDGTYSHSTHNGACSNHGGVKEWLDGSGR